MKINIVARKRLEINILTRHKLPDPPSPAESNGRPLNFVVNVCFVCRICLGCFAWRTGWICRPLIEQTDALTMYNVFYLRRLGMRDMLNGLRIWILSQKLPFSVGKKCFKDKFRKYNTLYLYVIYQQIWFQRSCGPMKSVSSFSSIDTQLIMIMFIMLIS